MTHIVCVCGSMKFIDVMQQAAISETLNGHVVLMPFVVKTETLSNEDHAALDNLHFEKIKLSSEILVVAAGGYVGESTRREISFAAQEGKGIRWWQP